MSEYQYYEFVALDRPLTPRQIDEVRKFSTRAEISATHFVNEYHYGDFRGDPDAFITRYYDVMFYLANWGTHRLLLGLPAEGIDLKLWRIYESESGIEIRAKGNRILVDLRSDTEEPEGYEEGEGQLASMVAVRNELLSGDMRPLYLGWLAAAGQLDPDEEEGQTPPIPAGLARLTAAQSALAEFLRVDCDLLRAASELSEPNLPGPAVTKDAWVASLPAEEKDRFLLRLLSEDAPGIGPELMRRYWQAAAPRQLPTAAGPSFKKLLAAASSTRTTRESHERELAALRRAERQAREAAERDRHLEELAGRTENEWKLVEEVLNLKKSAAYDHIIAKIRDLREVAIRKQALESFVARVNELRRTHLSKRSFISKLNKTGL